jgi:hypothetical protein
MKSSIKRILIFCKAFRAHRERCHGSIGTVIRDVGDNCEAWPAISTINKRIMITPISGIKELPQAVGAYAHIRGDGLEGSLN